MLEYKTIATLTVSEARVFLEPDQAETLLGVNLDSLSSRGGARLVDALANRDRPVEFWKYYLSGLYVTPLDVNRATRAALTRIPDLSSTQVDLLIKNRPYFSLGALTQEGADLAMAAKSANLYLMHPGYTFIDKPRGRTVEFVLNSKGILVKYRSGTNLTAIKGDLQEAGLQQIEQDLAERLLVCHWQVSVQEQPRRLRRLKQNSKVETVAPFLEDYDGQTRLVYPDRLDLALNQASEMFWQQILTNFGLTSIERYAVDYGSVRVKAQPQDLGALYRTLQALAKESIVRFVEPTSLAVNP
jgi:hypothetical protein